LGEVLQSGGKKGRAKERVFSGRGRCTAEAMIARTGPEREGRDRERGTVENAPHRGGKRSAYFLRPRGGSPLKGRKRRRGSGGV